MFLDAMAIANTSTRTTANWHCTHGEKKISVKDKICLCTHMRNYDCWTCGHYTYKLKGYHPPAILTVRIIFDRRNIFRDYQYSTDNKFLLPDQK